MNGGNLPTNLSTVIHKKLWIAKVIRVESVALFVKKCVESVALLYITCIPPVVNTPVVGEQLIVDKLAINSTAQANPPAPSTRGGETAGLTKKERRPCLKS